MAVDFAVLQKVRVGSHGNDLPLRQQHDQVAAADSREAVGQEDDGAVLGDPLVGIFEDGFGIVIEWGVWFLDNEDRWLAKAARANARRNAWPGSSRSPRSPTRVSYPIG